MTTQSEKAKQFHALHQSGCFVIPNPWDVGSANSKLAELGVRQISIGSIFANVAMDAVIKASRNLLDEGSFDFIDGLSPSSEIARIMFDE